MFCDPLLKIILISTRPEGFPRLHLPWCCSVATEAADVALGTVGTYSSVHILKVLRHSPVVGHLSWSLFSVVAKVLQASLHGVLFTFQPIFPSVFLTIATLGLSCITRETEG